MISDQKATVRMLVHAQSSLFFLLSVLILETRFRDPDDSDRLLYPRRR